MKAQQTSIGLSYRPDFKWDYNELSFASGPSLLAEGWSNSIGVQFQHDFGDHRWGFRLGVFYSKRINTTTTIIGVNGPTSSTVAERNLRQKSVNMSIPLELIFKAKPRIEIGLGLTYRHYIFFENYVDNEGISIPNNGYSSIQVGLINSFNWLKVGTTAIWPMPSRTFIAGFQLSSHFKFP